jgi:ABC-type transport system involved in multi-copper enzyme maturation permease subunit
MIRMKNVMAIARAETRITRRLVRYWVFISLAYLIALILYLQYSVIHGLFSSYSGTVGAMSPRFLLSAIGLYYSIVFLVGTIFLAFDVRARDIRERMVEVLDSRPYNNLELVSGRFLGIFLVSWIPIVILAILFEIIGFILRSSGSPVGDTIEIYSLFSFVFTMTVPALSFIIAMVFFVTLLVRNRLAAAVILLALIGLTYWATFALPFYYGTLFDVIGIGNLNFASDITPRLAAPGGLMQRLSMLLAAFSLLGFSAAVHPRLDSSSRRRMVAGSAAFMICAFLFSGAVYYKNTDIIRMRDIWKEAHAASSDEIIPDLKKVTGNIKIDPGKVLSLDLDITLSSPEEGSLQKAVFTLNPGQKVKSVSDASGNTIPFTHDKGLLVLTLPHILGPSEETTIHLIAQGLPDNRFAFLYSAVNLETLHLTQSNLLLLGEAPGIFIKAFVALMPGLRWLPVSGPEKGRDDPRVRTIDYFNLDLEVELPGGWLAAGPGRRNKVEGNNDGAFFRFSPQSPVPEVALIASRFESRSMEVEGVTLELLLNKKHMKNIEVLSETGEKIKEWVGNRLLEVKEYGLEYPYDALTLVEVPNILRSYGGGWRMGSTMAPPGMLLMRETGFPTTRFDSAFRNPESFKDREGGIQQAKWERLKSLFTNDFSGGNILAGASQNFFLYQTSAKGPEGIALNYVMEILSNLLIGETKSFFAAYLLADQAGMEQVTIRMIGSFVGNPSGQTNIIDMAISSVTSQPGVWDQALEVSLRDMDPWKNPARTINVLTLKGNAVAQSIVDTIGREKALQLLAAIRNDHKGESFSLDDMVKTGNTLGYNLEELLGDWLGSTDLPGFVCEKAEIYRIQASEDGSPRYQLLFTVRNDESAPGLFRFVYEFGGMGRNVERVKSDPIRLEGKSAVQFGTVMSRPPTSVLLAPYLSLNRERFPIQLPPVDQEKIKKADAFEGFEQIPWTLPEEPFIVVDDLDPGFKVVEGKQAKGFRIKARGEMTEEIDQGLPVAQVFVIPSNWSRRVDQGSWGKYRHTTAMVGAGEGLKKAMFTAIIPKAGSWDLELYMPSKESYFIVRKWGTWNLVIRDSNSDSHETGFDSKAATRGWNLVGSFNLPEGETSVIFSDKTDGQVVMADAIRWSPSAGKGDKE